jgi:hypothetical protein
MNEVFFSKTCKNKAAGQLMYELKWGAKEGGQKNDSY